MRWQSGWKAQTSTSCTPIEARARLLILVLLFSRFVTNFLRACYHLRLFITFDTLLVSFLLSGLLSQPRCCFSHLLPLHPCTPTTCLCCAHKYFGDLFRTILTTSIKLLPILINLMTVCNTTSLHSVESCSNNLFEINRIPRTPAWSRHSRIGNH